MKPYPPTALCSFRCSQKELSACTSPSRSAWALSHQPDPSATTVQGTCAGAVGARVPRGSVSPMQRACYSISVPRLGRPAAFVMNSLRNAIVLRNPASIQMCFVEKIPGSTPLPAAAGTTRSIPIFRYRKATRTTGTGTCRTACTGQYAVSVRSRSTGGGRAVAHATVATV